jgi:S-adenosylmethionine:tRNA ribosyltransferase-isomerase
MKLAALEFERPAHLVAQAPPEARGLARDQVRLLVSGPDGHHHSRFVNLANFLEAGDVLVVNDSATLPASLPAEGEVGAFRLNLSTRYGDTLWLAEPRWDAATPGPLPLRAGEPFRVGALRGAFVAPYPGLPRLWFVRFYGSASRAMRRCGEPIRYGYVKEPYPLEHYQTLFARQPGSAEMPSAARPFTPRVVARLKSKGVQLATITLHTGVSSLEVEHDEIEKHPLYPEPFEVPAETARLVNEARREGRRAIAVGTTVLRALESAMGGEQLVPRRGFTRLYLHPGKTIRSVDGLLTGLHDPRASHLAMLYALAGEALVKAGYAEAVRDGYLWHEFGDSQLILIRRRQRGTKLLVAV